jgi:hypothetical protein
MSSRRRNRRPSAPIKLRPGTKPSPPSFLARLNGFLAGTQKLPLWTLAGSLALACIPFAWSFFGNYAEQRAYCDQQSVNFHRAQAAGDDVLHTIDLLEAAFASARAVVANYEAVFPGKSVGDARDRPLLEGGEALIRTAQDSISVAEAALASAEFPDASLNAATTAMRRDLEAQQQKMEIFATLYAAALRSDAPAISAAVSDPARSRASRSASSRAVSSMSAVEIERCLFNPARQVRG